MFDRFDVALETAADRLTGNQCPSRLADAIRYAVAPPAHRLRPRLLYAVAAAIGEDQPEMTDNAAVAIELLHCASLVQDDLPAFDGSLERRGRPALHIVYGDATSILVSDALIIGAFEAMALGPTTSAYRARELTVLLARAAGAPRGAVAGQAWEEETDISLQRYHEAKTASLFEAATMAGAVAVGAEPEPWRELGRCIGLGYQLADDIADSLEPETVGSDAERGRPNAALRIGVGESKTLFDRYAQQANEAIPPCVGAKGLKALITRMLTVFRDAQDLQQHQVVASQSVPRAVAL